MISPFPGLYLVIFLFEFYTRCFVCNKKNSGGVPAGLPFALFFNI